MVTFTPKGLILPNPPAITVENLCRDPFFRNGIWIQQGSVGTLTDVLVGGPNGNGYIEYDMDTANTTSPMSITMDETVGISAIPVVAGETYNISCWAYKDIPSGAQTQRFGSTWYNSVGTQISNPVNTGVTVVEDTFTRVNTDVVAPAGAAFLRPSFIWSGTYPIGSVLRNADGQVTKGAGVKAFAVQPITLDDGDYVDINQINANLDRISLMGVGARPLLSSERPAVNSIDDMPGTIIFETDNNGILVRRRGNTLGNFIDAKYRSVAPGNWTEWNNSNPYAGWLNGDNNYKHARVSMLGRLIFVHIEAQIGTGGSIVGPGILGTSTLPTNKDITTEDGFGGDDITAGPWPIGHAQASIGGNAYLGRIMLINNQPLVRTIDTTNTGTGSSWGSTVPATWGVGDGVTFDFMYWSS